MKVENIRSRPDLLNLFRLNGRVPYTESGLVDNDVFRGFTCIGAEYAQEATKFRARKPVGAFCESGW